MNYFKKSFGVLITVILLFFVQCAKAEEVDVMVGFQDGRVAWYTIFDSGKCVENVCWEAHQDKVTAMTFSKKNNVTYLITGGEDGVIRVWNMKNGKKEIELQNGSPVQALTVHPKRNNILVSGGNDGSIRFFDLSKKALYEANDHFGTKEVKRVYSRVVLKGILSLGFISDSKLVVVYPSNTFAVLKISFNNDGTISREREKKEFPLCVPGGEVSSVMRAAFNYKDPLKVIFRCFPVGRVFCRNVRELILRKKSDIINADGSKGEVLPGPLFSYNPSKKDEVVFCGCSIDGTRMRFDVCQVTDEEETRHDKDSKCNYKTYITKLEQLSIGCNEVVNIQKEAEPCSIQVLPSHLITEVTQLMKVRSRSLK